MSETNTNIIYKKSSNSRFSRYSYWSRQKNIWLLKATYNQSWINGRIASNCNSRKWGSHSTSIRVIRRDWITNESLFPASELENIFLYKESAELNRFIWAHTSYTTCIRRSLHFQQCWNRSFTPLVCFSQCDFISTDDGRRPTLWSKAKVPC
jgi:hypothetical protein